MTLFEQASMEVMLRLSEAMMSLFQLWQLEQIEFWSLAQEGDIVILTLELTKNGKLHSIRRAVDLHVVRTCTINPLVEEIRLALHKLKDAA